MANFPSSLDTNSTLYVLANQAKCYLAGDLSTSGGNNGQASSIDVDDGSDFPATAGFFLVGQELISYTIRNSNKFSGITRAYGGTTAALHRTGSQVKMVYVAEYHNALKDAIIEIETAIGIEGAEKFAKTFEQATDPALTPSNNVKNGDHWIDTGSGQASVRIGGTWKTYAG